MQALHNHHDLGATVIPGQGDMDGKNGYAFSPYPEREMIVEGEVTKAQIMQYLLRNRDLLERKDHGVGVWKDQQTGKTYVDISIIDPDRKHALIAAAEAHQLAIYDLQHHQELRVAVLVHEERLPREFKCEFGLNRLGLNSP